MTGDSRGNEPRGAMRAALFLAIAASPVMGSIASSSSFGGNFIQHRGGLSGPASARRSDALGFCGPTFPMGAAVGGRAGAICRRFSLRAGAPEGRGRGKQGALKMVGAYAMDGGSLAGPSASLGAHCGALPGTSAPAFRQSKTFSGFTTPSSDPTDFPSSLPYLFSDTSEVDSTLKGIKVGHGIRYSRHPKALLFSEQPVLSDVVNQLHNVGMNAVYSPSGHNKNAALDFTFGQIQRVREEVEHGHLMSERKLSALAHLLIARFSKPNKYQITSMVTAESNKNVFTLSKNIPLEDIDEGADSAQLARDQLQSLTVDGLPATMREHSIEFAADEWNNWGVHRIIAHARPVRDLWRVIADSLFGIEHEALNRFVEDEMYHLKIVVEDPEYAEKVHKSLRNMEWTDTELRDRFIAVSSSTRKGKLVEQCEHSAEALGHRVHLDEISGQASGDRRSTIEWWGALINIRVQTLNEHYAETEMITMANREKLAKCREQQQEVLAAQSPLYGFARNFMRWMLNDDASALPPPYAPGAIQITVHH